MLLYPIVFKNCFVVSIFSALGVDLFFNSLSVLDVVVMTSLFLAWFVNCFFNGFGLLFNKFLTRSITPPTITMTPPIKRAKPPAEVFGMIKEEPPVKLSADVFICLAGTVLGLIVLE